MTLLHRVEQAFAEKYGAKPQLFAAPGRINLIGEHTDYNEGFVLPAAIQHHVLFAAAPNGTQVHRIYALDYREEVQFSTGEAKPGRGWAPYLMGMVHGFQQLGFQTSGIDCVFGSNIPIGAGLSSSAALCCGFGFALSELLQLQVAPLAIAKIAQYAEHQFAGVKCGIMDQYASLFGVKDAALLLDCRDLSHEVIPVDMGEYRILLIDTKVKHELASTAYNDRREACEEGVKQLQRGGERVTSLRDVTRAQLYAYQDRLGDDVFVKCLFVVEEIARTQEAARLLKQGDLEAFGSKLYDTHWGLSQAYEVSCEELDYLVMLVEEDRTAVRGARMMGGGFGGCTINLVRKDKIDYIKGYVHEKYFATFGKEPDFYLMDLSQGVHRVT